MWHEARKQEKQIYKLFDSSTKKKEIARRIQEQNLKESNRGLIVYGHRMRIYDDIEQQSKITSSLTKWQGDDSVLIDRFDVRNFLESIPKKSKIVSSETKNADEFIEEIKIDYERYKELVAHEFTGESEKYCLSKIEEKDGKKAKLRLQKQQQKGKKNLPQKPTNKGATVGFKYDEGETAGGSQELNEEDDEKEPIFNKPESDSEGSEDEDELFCDKIGSIIFSSNDWERLNRIAEKYHVPKDAFDKLYDVDRCDELDTAKIHEIERERLSISGRAGKRARAKLQHRKNLILRDPLNEDAVASLKKFAERKMKADLEEESEESSDESDFEEKVEFITSFGGDDDAPKKQKTKLASIKETSKADVDDQKRLARLKNRRSESPFGDNWIGQGASKVRKSRSKSPVTIFKRKPKSRRSRSKSPSRSPKKSNKRSRSHSLSISPPRRSSNGGWLRARIQNLGKHKEDSDNVAEKRSSDLSSVGGNSEDDKELEIRSSMSESEKEKIEIENRKRRIRRTKRELKKRKNVKKEDSEDSEEERKALAAKNLKMKLQKELDKTKKELKMEELEKKAQQEEDDKNRHDANYVARKYTARRTPHRSLSPSSETEKESKSHKRHLSPRRSLRRRSTSLSSLESNPIRRRVRSRSRSLRRYSRKKSRSRSRSPKRHSRRYRSRSRSKERRREYSRRSRSRSKSRRY